MVRLCLMASYGCLPGLVIKDCLPILPSPGARQEISRSGSFGLKLHQFEEPWSPPSGLPETSKFIKLDSTLRKPVLIDVQDTSPDSVLFSYGIAEKCTRQEEILQFLTSGAIEIEKSKLDSSLLADLIGSQPSTADMLAPSVYEPSFYDADGKPSLVQPIVESNAEKLLVDFMGDLARHSKILVGIDGQVSFTGSRTEMKDLLSIIAELYLSKNPALQRKQSVVPYFHRRASRVARDSPMTPQTPKIAPLKSPEKVRLKPSSKKNTAKAIRERDFYRKNYFHACECLLSLMMNNRQHEKTAVLSLKKSGPEVPELLTQFSACIAGTGLAVLFSVACKVACGRLPFCISKLFNTGIGLGLVWLSAAVNGLRDTILPIIKNSGKLGLDDDETMTRVDKSVKEIFFRAVTLMAVTALKFA